MIDSNSIVPGWPLPSPKHAGSGYFMRGQLNEGKLGMTQGKPPEEFLEHMATDINGRFRFDALGPGIYHLSLGRPLSRWWTEYQKLTSIELHSGETFVRERLTIQPEEQEKPASQ